MSTVAPRQAAAPAPAVVSGPTRVLSIDAFRGFVMFLMLAEAMRLWTVHDAFPESRFWAFVAFFLIFFVVCYENFWHIAYFNFDDCPAEASRNLFEPHLVPYLIRDRRVET